MSALVVHRPTWTCETPESHPGSEQVSILVHFWSINHHELHSSLSNASQDPLLSFVVGHLYTPKPSNVLHNRHPRCPKHYWPSTEVYGGFSGRHTSIKKIIRSCLIGEEECALFWKHAWSEKKRLSFLDHSTAQLGHRFRTCHICYRASQEDSSEPPICLFVALYFPTQSSVVGLLFKRQRS